MAKLTAKLENDAVCERREDYIQDITLRNNAILSDPSTTPSFYLTSPCGTVLVNLGTMTQKSTGNYQYIFSLSDSSIYGEYIAEVRVTDGNTHQIFRTRFYVLPWNMVDDIRTISGQTIAKVDDDDIAPIAWFSFREAINRAMEYHYHEKLCCSIDARCSCCGNVECGEDCRCAKNTVSSPIESNGYQLKHAPIGDWQIDSNVRGCECDDSTDECHNDICGIWVDSNGNCHEAAVEVVDATCGHIKAYQSDCSTAIPVDNWGIFINYHSTWRTWNLTRFKKAVAYLAAYELALRENLSAKKVSGCDEGSRVAIIDRLYEQYRNIIDSISEPMLGGVK